MRGLISFKGNLELNLRLSLEWRKGTKLQSVIENKKLSETYPLKEFWETFVYDGFNHSTIDICKPNTHEGSNDQENGQQVNILSFFACI